MNRMVAAIPIAVALQALPVQAQGLPEWPLANICRADATPGQCRIFEGEARRTLSGSWEFVPEAIRKSCLASSSDVRDQSYRNLAGCVEIEMERADDSRAVRTARTPAEPAPAPPPAANPGAAMPPIPALPPPPKQ